jgi:hypothetical protein
MVGALMAALEVALGVGFREYGAASNRMGVENRDGLLLTNFSNALSATFANQKVISAVGTFPRENSNNRKEL